MSDKVQNAIYENVVKPELQKEGKQNTGKVVSVDYSKKVEGKSVYNYPYADVKIIEKNINEEHLLEDVPIMANALSYNVDGAKIQKGDRVIISYYRGDKLHPRIIGKHYPNGKQRQEEMKVREGVFKADAYGYFG